jgi:hypothetical protein
MIHLVVSRCAILSITRIWSSSSKISRRPRHSTLPAGPRLIPRQLPLRICKFIFLCLLFVALSCAGTQPVDETPVIKLAIADINPQGISGQHSQDGLVEISPPDAKSWRFYIKKRPHLQNYDKVLIARTTIAYRNGVHGWRHRGEQKIRIRLRKALRRSIANGQYWTLASEPDERTLIARISLLDLVVEPRRLRNGFGTTSNVSFVAADGNANVAFELFDATSGEPVLRFIERYRLPGGSFPSGDIDARRLGLVLRAFARRMGDRMESRYRIVRNLERQKLLHAISEIPPQPVDIYDGGDKSIQSILSKLPDGKMLMESLETVPPVPMSAFIISALFD